MNPMFWKPAFITVIALGVVTASGFLLRSNAGPEHAQRMPRGPEDIPAADAPHASEVAKSPVATRSDPVRDSAEERRQLLESVGVLASAHCYQTYMNIGLIADGKDSGSVRDEWHAGDVEPGSASAGHREALRFAAAEYDRIAALPEVASRGPQAARERLQRKARQLREIATH